MGFLKIFKKKDKKQPQDSNSSNKNDNDHTPSRSVGSNNNNFANKSDENVYQSATTNTNIDNNDNKNNNRNIYNDDTLDNNISSSDANYSNNNNNTATTSTRNVSTNSNYSQTTTSQQSGSRLSSSFKNPKSSLKLGILRKPSFNYDSPIDQKLNDINSSKITELPDELLPIVTLINHQQSRSYFKGNSYYYDSTQQIIPSDSINSTTNFNWLSAYVELNGNDISVDVENSPTAIINICDCELNYDKNEIILTILITNQSKMYFQFNSIDELNNFYSCLLLCKFEYQQLQEAYTGALLSSQAIHFSDIRTLLSPNNKQIKEEWCVIRFPFLNDKWIRCFIVILPNNKIEIYTHSSKSKKYLLSTIINGNSCYTIYPNDPSQIQNNSLMRLFANCYINSELLNIILNDDNISSIDENISLKNIRRNSRSNSRSRSRTNSLSKRMSVVSLRSTRSRDSNLSSSNDNNSNFSSIPPPIQQHQRISSLDTTISESSFNNSKTPKKLNKKNILRTHLIYIIPESHASVKPCEIMLRFLIPVLNTFKLYGRPTKFISSRTDKNSLLFGLPQLPNTYYLNEKSSLDLVNLNINNSLNEKWTSNDWNLIFKELMVALLNKGWKGGSYQGDLVNLNFSLNLNKSSNKFDFDNDGYDPMDDFIIGTESSVNRSVSINDSMH
ncbi:hypothetical protein C6P42_005411 [Pichia californica]|nr:hypothetical protein C6P42_005411 [[Candida] californica]